MKKMRVLLGAYQCGPGLGSVSQIGWEWYSRLCRRTPVTLITHVRNREALTQAGAPLPNSEVHYIDTEWFAGPLYRFSSKLFPKSQHSVFLVSSVDFYVYDYCAMKLIRKKGPGSWDIVHAVTPVSPVGATRLHRLGLPVILGPWNGGLASPRSFPEIMREDSGWIYRVRDAGKLLDRFTGGTKRAARILSATRATDESIPSASRASCLRMLENGVDLDLFQPGSWDPPPSSVEPLRILFTGRLVPFKGVSMLLEALARVRGEFRFLLTVAGDGPLRQSLEQESRERGLGDAVRFAGNLPLSEVAAAMRQAHVFCLPSIRESGGAVLLEAMASAIPAMAVNYGGPAEIVDDEVGRALPCEGREAVVAGIADALRDIVRNPEAWRRRGQMGRCRAQRHYGWDAKVNTAMEVYAAVLRERAAHV